MSESAAPQKVVRVIARLNVGGPARQAILLHAGLRCRGFDTVLVHGTVSPDEADLEDLLPAGRDGIVKVRELGARVRPLDDLRAFATLVRLVFREKPDILHTHTAKAGALGRLAAAVYNLTRARPRRCLVVHTFHGHVFEGYFGPFGNASVRLAERLLARVTDCVVAISPRQRSALVEQFRVAPGHRVTVVPLGLELDALREVDGTTPAFGQSLGFAAGSILVGCIGRLVKVKDVATLLDALALASREVPLLRLAVVGDGPEREALERRARMPDLAGRVAFTGWRRDLAAIYQGLDVVALSSRNEGTPVALIEAMAAGRPIVATAVGGVPDIVEHGRSGLLVPPGDAATLASALVTLAGDEPRRARLGEEGRAAAARHDPGRLLDEIGTLYCSGLAARRAPARQGP